MSERKKTIEPNLLAPNILKKALSDGIDILYKHDQHLIVQNLAERSIAHMLAVHLMTVLSEHKFHIDCEYNGDIEGPGLRKTIWVLKEKLSEIKKIKKTEEEWRELSVFPDIIIHRRGSNLNNNLIIEIKKNYGQKVDDEFDRMKLSCYTAVINDETPQRNHLNYALGAYIEIDTYVGNPRKSFRIQYYRGGEPSGDVITINEPLPAIA